MAVRSLGYIYWNTPLLEEWSAFAASVLGLMPVDGPHAERRYLRMDDRPYRLVLGPAESVGLEVVGYEVADDFELEDLIGDLKSAGLEVETGTDIEAADRLVSGLIRFRDPSGLPIEAFYGPVLSHVPLDTPRNLEFITGDMGLGHLVVGVGDLEPTVSFYRRVLGFELRNTMYIARDGVRRKTYFLGCNPRHHTVAMAGVQVPGHVLHFMVQVRDLDDVGRALDACTQQAIPITMSLGRHTNDHMVSFYCQAPDGVRVEYGYDGLRVEGEVPVCTYEITKSSFWGHHPPGG